MSANKKWEPANSSLEPEKGNMGFTKGNIELGIPVPSPSKEIVEQLQKLGLMDDSQPKSQSNYRFSWRYSNAFEQDGSYDGFGSYYDVYPQYNQESAYGYDYYGDVSGQYSYLQSSWQSSYEEDMLEIERKYHLDSLDKYVEESRKRREFVSLNPALPTLDKELPWIAWDEVQVMVWWFGGAEYHKQDCGLDPWVGYEMFTIDTISPSDITAEDWELIEYYLSLSRIMID